MGKLPDGRLLLLSEVSCRIRWMIIEKAGLSGAACLFGKGLFAADSGGDGRDGFLIEPSAGNHQHEDGNPQKARFNMQIIKQDDVNEIDLQCQQTGLFECQTDPVSGCAGIQQRKQPAQKKDKSRRNKNKGIPVQAFDHSRSGTFPGNSTARCSLLCRTDRRRVRLSIRFHAFPTGSDRRSCPARIQ